MLVKIKHAGVHEPELVTGNGSQVKILVYCTLDKVKNYVIYEILLVLKWFELKI